MSVVFDLDARRAQYADDTKPVQLGGVVYQLPAKLPILVGEAFRDGRWLEAVAMLFGQKHVDTVAPLLDKDLFIELAQKLYAPDDEDAVGESSASSNSSATNGAPSKRTSNGSTGSTSRKRVSAKAT